MIASSAVVLASILCAERASACASDTECKGDRVCDAGLCVDPKPAAARPKPEATQTFVRTPADVAPRTPRVVDVAPATKNAVEPATSPWQGAKAPVRVAITLVGGDSRRQSENLLFGTGFGLQLGYTTRSGFYLGVHWHEHLENKAGATGYTKELGLIDGHASGRSSYYLVDLGGHIRVASWLTVRLTAGVGLVRASEKVTVTSPRFDPVWEKRERVGFALQPKLAIMVRPSPGWYFGPQLATTTAALDGSFRLGAVETLGAIGWVL
ncbi:MAG: hypothetical protein HYV09_20820 [Deltaproteobacteria bacterium]|nr:hypothetical protein [Deltaproteobacteria bacterium]